MEIHDKIGRIASGLKTIVQIDCRVSTLHILKEIYRILHFVYIFANNFVSGSYFCGNSGWLAYHCIITLPH